MRFVISAVTALALLSSVHAQPIVSEFRLTTQGTIAEIVIALYNYDIILDGKGEVRRVETVIDRNLITAGTFQRETIKQKNGKNSEFSRGRLSSIGDVQVAYVHGSDRVDRIGDLKILYLGKDNRISQVGCVELKYHAASGWLESVGLARIYQDHEGKRISEVAVVDRNACTARVRILGNVEEFK